MGKTPAGTHQQATSFFLTPLFLIFSTHTHTQRIPGRDGAAITSLAWAADADEASRAGSTPAGTARLFSAGLDGRVTEWCPPTRAPAAPPADIGGGAVWGLAPDPAGTRLAAACDDGGIRILAPGPAGAGQGPALVRALPRTPGRALCVAWHPSGASLACGTSEGAVHVWDVGSGREVLRIDAGGSASTAGGAGAEATPVWCVAVLADGTLATGDAAGAVRLWCGATGAQVAAFPAAHAADVLALVAVPPPSLSAPLELFSAGADGGVASFRAAPPPHPSAAVPASASAPPPAWVAGPAKRPHTHDVRCLTLIPGRKAGGGRGRKDGGGGGASPPLLASGGNDAHVLIHAATAAGFGGARPARLSRAPQAPLTALIPAAGPDPPLILAVSRRTADVWALGRAAGRAAQEAGPNAGWGWREGAPVDVTARPARLARVTLAGVDHAGCGALARGAGGSEALWLALGSRSTGAARGGGGGGRLFCIAPALPSSGGRGAAAPATPPPVRRVALPPGLPAPVALAFVPGAGTGGAPWLCSAAPDGSVAVVSLPGEEGGAGAAGETAAGARLLAVLRPPALATPSASAAPLSSADPAIPPVTALVASPCGRWVAAVGPAAVDVYRVGGGGSGGGGGLKKGGRGRAAATTPAAAAPPPAPSHHWRLPSPPDGSAPAQAAFGPGGDTLVIASAACGLAGYGVEERAPQPWPPGGCGSGSGPLGGGGGGVPPIGLPGAPSTLSLRPLAGVRSALLATPAALCAVDLGGPPVPGGSSAGGGPHQKRKRASRSAAPPPPGGAPAPAGHNPRPLPLEHPCLAAGYVGPCVAVLVERRWADVAAGLPPPLVRHRYGT